MSSSGTYLKFTYKCTDFNTYETKLLTFTELLRCIQKVYLKNYFYVNTVKGSSSN